MNPVVLVNGFLAPAVSMVPLRLRLERAGLREVYIARMPPLGVQSIQRLATALGSSVDRIREQSGAEQVDIVGVSQGGLAALWWLQNGGASCTRRFVALGTPFQGTWFAALGIPLFGAVSRGVWQSLPASQAIQQMHRIGIPEGVEVTSVAIPGDPVAPPERCRLEGAAFELAPTTRSPLRHQALILSSGCAQVAARLLTRTDE